MLWCLTDDDTDVTDDTSVTCDTDDADDTADTDDEMYLMIISPPSSPVQVAQSGSSQAGCPATRELDKSF